MRLQAAIPANQLTELVSLIDNPEDQSWPLDPTAEYAWLIWHHDRASGAECSPWDGDGLLFDLIALLRDLEVYHEIDGITLWKI